MTSRDAMTLLDVVIQKSEMACHPRRAGAKARMQGLER
jgi:hypothetical protein